MFAPRERFLARLAEGWRLCVDRHGCPTLPHHHGEFSVMLWRPA